MQCTWKNKKNYPNDKKLLYICVGNNEFDENVHGMIGNDTILSCRLAHPRQLNRTRVGSRMDHLNDFVDWRDQGTAHMVMPLPNFGDMDRFICSYHPWPWVLIFINPTYNQNVSCIHSPSYLSYVEFGMGHTCMFMFVCISFSFG